MFLECLPVVCVCICLRQVNGKQGIKSNTFERITMATRDVYCLTLLSQCCCDNNFFNGHRERSKGFSCCVEGLQCMVNCDTCHTISGGNIYSYICHCNSS